MHVVRYDTGMVSLIPLVGRQDRTRALDLLAEGFPERDPADFRRALDRAADVLGEEAGPLAHLLTLGGAVQGVVLTLPSLRSDGLSLVNLSSWYVRPAGRVAAPAMLRRLADLAPVVTDLTPTPAVVRLSLAVGFAVTADRTAHLPLPLLAAVPGSARLVAPNHPEAGPLDPGDDRLLAEHARLGCLTAVVLHEGGAAPLVVRPGRRYRLPVGEVILADLRVLAEARGAVARWLLRAGLVALAVDLPAGARFPGSRVVRPRPPRLARGPVPPGRIDYAWSELVFF